MQLDEQSHVLDRQRKYRKTQLITTFQTRSGSSKFMEAVSKKFLNQNVLPLPSHALYQCVSMSLPTWVIGSPSLIHELIYCSRPHRVCGSQHRSSGRSCVISCASRGQTPLSSKRLKTPILTNGWKMDRRYHYSYQALSGGQERPTVPEL